MAERIETELVVIGAGPGGYTAAFRAADLGKKVVVVETDKQPGGTCLLRGCIPSKALLHVAHILHETKEAKAWGVHFEKPKIDLNGMRSWKDSVIQKLSGGLVDLHKKRSVRFVQGQASFANATTLNIKGSSDVSQIVFQEAIIAAGSKPLSLPGIAIDNQDVWDSTGALALNEVPKRLLVVGGGVIALELGQVYAELGSEVTVVELMDSLLPMLDRDLVRPLEQRLKKTFKAIHLSSKVTGVKKTTQGLEVTLEGAVAEKVQMFDKVLCAIGRKPCADSLGLENTNIKVSEKGFIEVDKQQRTAEPNIYAIGDIVAGPMLAHKASYEGRVVAEVIAGEEREADAVVIPAVMYTDPEVAWCGLTEAEAKKKNIPVAIGKFPWAASGRNLALGRNEGLTKIIFDPKTERVLGVGIVGAGAGELLGEGLLAIEMAAVAHDIAGSIHAHPSLAETMHGAAEVFLGSVTDIFVPKK